MPDTSPIRRSQVGTFASGSTDVRLTDASLFARVIVRGAPETNLATQLGAVSSGSSVLRGTVRIGCVRPNEWLYSGPPDDVAAAVADLDLAGHTAVTDVSHARGAIRITGAKASDLLERGCSLDFSSNMFPNNAMATAPIAGVRCDIIRDDVDGTLSYVMTFDRSYAEYMTDTLAAIQTEFV